MLEIWAAETSLIPRLCVCRASIWALGGGLVQSEKDFLPDTEEEWHQPPTLSCWGHGAVGGVPRVLAGWDGPFLTGHPEYQGMSCSPHPAFSPSCSAHRTGLLTQFPCRPEPSLSGFPPAPRYGIPSRAWSPGAGRAEGQPPAPVSQPGAPSAGRPPPRADEPYPTSSTSCSV